MKNISIVMLAIGLMSSGCKAAETRESKSKEGIRKISSGSVEEKVFWLDEMNFGEVLTGAGSVQKNMAMGRNPMKIAGESEFMRSVVL